MPDTPTPGQLAYETYCRAMYDTLIVPWRTVLPASKCAWEAAAQAVLDDDSDGRDTVRAHFRYAIGDRLRLAGTAPGPWIVRSRRWIEREVLGPYAEYGLEVPDGTLAWEVEADLIPWEDTAHAYPPHPRPAGVRGLLGERSS